MISSFVRKKRFALCLVLVLLTGLLAGCGGEQAAITIQGDGTCGFTIRYLYDKSEYETMTKVDPSISAGLVDYQSSLENIRGKDYYVFSRDFTFSNCQDMQNFFTDSSVYEYALSSGSKDPSIYGGMEALFTSAAIDTGNFIGELNEGSDFGLMMNTTNADITLDEEDKEELGELGYQSVSEYYEALGVIMDISITFPAPILESNGNISGNTVSWDLKNCPMDGKLVASTSGTPISSDTTPPVIHLKKSKTGIYGPGLLKVTDDICLKSITLNGKPCGSNFIPIYRNGKNVVVATDGNNNVARASFRVDAKNPKIKGAKYGKVYHRPVKLRFSDNTKIKSVKVNGKKQRNKKKITLKKRGKYRVVVTDQVGNQSVMSFKIK